MEDKLIASDTFAIKDINVASFLMASGAVKFAGIERTANKTAFFHFAPKDKAESLVDSYWADSAPSVQPRILFNSLRNLKDVIFGGNQ